MFLEFLLSRLLGGRLEQCGHCDDLTISSGGPENARGILGCFKIPIKSQKHIKMLNG